MQQISPAESSDFLQKRIALNSANQTTDLNTWIFTHLSFSQHANILELCPGVGMQTQKFVEHLSPNGHLTLIDISKDSIDKLLSTIDEEKASIITPICGNIDDVANLCSDKAPFDVIFCAYGLYYSEDAQTLLKNLLQLISRTGKLVVCGPYGNNNHELFTFLTECGVVLPKAVAYSSSIFMEQVVLSLCVRFFPNIVIHTMCNQIVWDSPDKFMQYWMNTTFYDVAKQQHVAERINDFFHTHSAFITTKHVMLLEAYFA